MNRILVVGVPRSATTWLAEMLAATPGSRAVLEPDNPAWDPGAGTVRRLYGSFPVLHAGEDAPDYARVWDRAFAASSDGASGNLILKTVHATFAMEWLVDRYAPRVVLIERNPLNVVTSWIRYKFEVGDLATRQRIRTDHIEPLRLPSWDPYAPRILQVAWAVGVLMSVLRQQARAHAWTVVSHETMCVEPSAELRALAAAVDLEWSDDAERHLTESDAPGEGAETKRLAKSLPSQWRSYAYADMRAVIEYLGQFPELAAWIEAADQDGSGARHLADPAPGRTSLLHYLDQVNAKPSDNGAQINTRRPKLRYLAFYLPQFHPIPENEAWWGQGFTEWTNVKKAVPCFPGHYQPHVPAQDLGYYDLRDPAARELQAALAQRYGVDGFVYYHYWFLGRRLLGQPFDDVLASGRPGLPFCLCWANENWTRTWDGGDRRILVEQQYSHDDDVNHIRWLATALADPRYIRVDGRPLLIVYRASKLPEPGRTSELWRREAVRLGVGDPYLCCVESFADERVDPRTLGFDAAVEFPAGLAGWYQRGPALPVETARGAGEPGGGATDHGPLRAYSYPVAAQLTMSRPRSEYKRYPCVTPGWDNSPRRPATPTIFVGSNPELYERWLARTAREFSPYSPEENLVFVNAWNEWGESNHLEPDRRWGYEYLEAHLRATGRAVH